MRFFGDSGDGIQEEIEIKSWFVAVKIIQEEIEIKSCS